MLVSMTAALFDQRGNRKYLSAKERLAFARAAYAKGGAVATFCLTLAYTGARVSEILALTAERIDKGNGAIVFESLKRRERGVFRAVPVPLTLLTTIERVHGFNTPGHDVNRRIWPWSRTTAWKRVKEVMLAAKIDARLATPKAARHAFGVDAIQNSVALNIVQRWMGHARIETTTIYANVIGKEERALARRTWRSLESSVRGQRDGTNSAGIKG